MKMSQTNLQYTAPGDVGGQVLAELVKVLGIVIGVATTPFLLDLLAERWPQFLPWFWVVGVATAVLTIIVGIVYAVRQARQRRRQAERTAPQKLFLERILPPFSVKAYAQRKTLNEKQLAALKQALESGAISAEEYEKLTAELTPKTDDETAVSSWSLLPTIIITIGVFILLPAVVALLMQYSGNENPGLIAQFFGAPVFLLWITAELLYFYPLRTIDPKRAVHILGISKNVVQIVAALVLWTYVGIAFGIGNIAWLFYVGAGLALVGLILGIVAAVLNGRLARLDSAPAEDTAKPEPKKRETEPRIPSEPVPEPTTPTKTPFPTPEALPDGRFVLIKQEWGHFGFQLNLTSGETVLMSEDYVSKEECLNKLRVVRHSALLEERYWRETAGSQRHYFVLLDAQEQIIAASPVFSTMQMRNTNIEYAKALAFRAPLQDKTGTAATTPDETPVPSPTEETPQPERDTTSTKTKESPSETTPPDRETHEEEETAVPTNQETDPSSVAPPETEPDLTLLPETKAPKFQLFRGENKEYYFRLVARNGETVLASEGYKRKGSSVNGIRSVKKNALLADQFRPQINQNGLFYFTLVALNHEVIGMSEMYTSTQSRDEGITAVARMAWDAPIEDLTLTTPETNVPEKTTPPAAKKLKKKAKKTPARQPRFQIFQGEDSQYYFHLRAANGEIILASEGYTTLRGCENGVRSVQQNGPLEERYVEETAGNGQYFFKLLAGNHKVIGVSETYTTKQNQEKGITAVQQAVPKAIVEQILSP